MAAFLTRASRRPSTIISRLSSSEPQCNRIQSQFHFPQPYVPLRQLSSGSIQTLDQTDVAVSRSLYMSDLIRILRTYVEYQWRIAPPYQPESRFDIFTVDENRGQNWIRLTGKSRRNEDIKITAGMFDGRIPVLESGVDSDDVKLQQHLKMLVCISKADRSNELGFICNVFQSRLQILNVCSRPPDGLSPFAYRGPIFEKLDLKLQKALHYYLDERGINCDLATFLHHYMLNKGNIELTRWLEKLLSFMEK